MSRWRKEEEQYLEATEKKKAKRSKKKTRRVRSHRMARAAVIPRTELGVITKSRNCKKGGTPLKAAHAFWGRKRGWKEGKGQQRRGGDARGGGKDSSIKKGGSRPRESTTLGEKTGSRIEERVGKRDRAMKPVPPASAWKKSQRGKIASRGATSLSVP